MSSPTSPVRRKQPVLPGFRPSPRPKRRPIAEMTIRELQDLHNFNAKILAEPGASVSSYVQRVRAEQAAIESRLIDVDAMETINAVFKKTKIKGESDMEVDEPEEPTTSRTIEAKRKALAQYGTISVKGTNHSDLSAGSSFTVQEAIELERQAHLQDKERHERILEKKKRLGMPIKGEVLTREEREARIWAFMTHKPTESDMEDNSDEDDDDDEDPASWFEDDQDDGRKGQDIVDPDYADLSDLIRIDEARIPGYGNIYGNNEGD